MNRQKTLVDSLPNGCDKARMEYLSFPYAEDRLVVPPNPKINLHLRSFEFRTGALYRLGVPLYQSEGSCPTCPSFSDMFGDHAISCGARGERIARHNQMRDALYHTAVSALLTPTREDRALLPGGDH